MNKLGGSLSVLSEHKSKEQRIKIDNNLIATKSISNSSNTDIYLVYHQITGEQSICKLFKNT